MASSSRPRGYMSGWKPQPQTAQLLVNVREVIEEYQQYGAMTVRQIFYRLVGQYDYPKDERAYARLCEACVKGRRAGIIPFSAIRDEPEEAFRTAGWDSPAEWWEGELDAAKGYSRDPHEGQQYHVELWCEAAGMAPMLAGMVREYGVDVYSTGGFSSVTVTHSTAKRVCNRKIDDDRETVFLHVGDFDPSGQSIFDSMSADIGAFVYQSIDDEDLEPFYQGDSDVEGWFTAERVALTRAQVQHYNLPTAPPKKSDSRSNNWVGQTCQLEAMDPATLNRVIVNAVLNYIDVEQLARVNEQGEEERDEIVRVVEDNLRRMKGE